MQYGRMDVHQANLAYYGLWRILYNTERF
jgi:hypothetical protein